MSNDILNYIVLPIDGMTCSSCVGNVKKSLHKINWIKTVSVNLAAEQAVIGFSGRYTDTAALKENITSIGYSIRMRTSEIAIAGFDDPTQIANLQKLLLNIPGVENCNFNLANQTLQIEYIPGIVLVRVVEKTIAYATGIKIVWRENSAVADEEHEKESLLKIKVQFLNSIFATISAVIIFILMMPGLFEFVTIWPESIRNGVAFLLSTWSLFFAGRDRKSVV